MSPQEAIEALRKLPQFVEFRGSMDAESKKDAVLHVLSGQIIAASEVTIPVGLLKKMQKEPALRVSNISYCGESTGSRGVYLVGASIIKYVTANAM